MPPPLPPVRLATLLGDYAVTRALKSGALRSSRVHLDFADVRRPATAFQRVVRALEFDVAELALMTFLIAKAHGKPLVLLPAVVLARFQHPFLVFNAERGALTPSALPGKRVAIRAYPVTTAIWVRGILAEQYGVTADSVRWVTFEEAHVAEFRDPPNVERAAEGRTMTDMLVAGEVDAAIVADATLPDPRLRRLIPEPDAAARAWHAKHGAIQINHMVVVKASLVRAQPDAVREVYRLLAESRRLGVAAAPPRDGPDLNPFGVEPNRRNLEVALDYALRQGLLPRPLRVDDLFDDVTRSLDE